MKARLWPLCLLSAALGANPAFAQTDAKPEAPKADKSSQMEQRQQERLKRFDKNGDGQLDETEKAAMKEAMKLERGPRGAGDIGSLGGGAAAEPAPGGDRFVRELLKRFDKDGDGKLDAAELAELIKNRAGGGPGAPGGRMREQMTKMFDKNGDGVLDESERAEAMKAFMADHPELGPPGK